jgi:thiol-disulfide isomerase/thioredoxin
MRSKDEKTMKFGGFNLCGMVFLAAAAVFCSYPAERAAAAAIKAIDESALDAKLGDKQNRLALVFMAAWCAPCIDELPTLNKLHKKFKPQGLEIIGISIDLDGPDAMQPVISALKIDFPVYWYGEKAVEKFTLFAIPMLLLVKDGEIVERIHGRRPSSFLDEKFTKFLK